MSNLKNHFNFDLVLKQLHKLHYCTRHLIYYRTLKSEIDQYNFNKSRFWGLTADAHVQMFIIEWCKIFGTDSEDCHWKNAINNSTEKKIIENDFRNRIYKKTGFNSTSWKKYHKEILDLRNKYIAHLENLSRPGFPLLDNALNIIYVYDEWVREIFGITWFPGDLDFIANRISCFEKDVLEILKPHFNK